MAELASTVTADVALRPLDRQHMERTREWANDPEVSLLMDRARPVTDHEHEEWFTGLARREDAVFFAIEADGESAPRHVGNVWLWGIDWRHRKAEARIVVGE